MSGTIPAVRTTRNNKPQTISLYDTDACMQDTFAKTVPKTNGISQKDCKVPESRF
nr:PREDICTED: uncharacterized protein LOC109038015 isoform X2 [Bemisia tabaci]